MKKKCSERLAIALKIKGMKQKELSDKTEINKATLSQYFSGMYEPKQKNLYKLAKALNVSEAWLMGFDVPMERAGVSIFNAEQAQMYSKIAQINSLSYEQKIEYKKIEKIIFSCFGEETVSNKKSRENLRNAILNAFLSDVLNEKKGKKK